MAEKIFWHILFLCVMWTQGITGTFADKEIKQSSDLLVRQKRVVSYLEGEDVAIRINQAPYVVRIKENGQNRCVGSILSRYVAVTSAPCVSLRREQYKLVSSAAAINHGNDHDVTEIRIRTRDIHRRNFDGIALLIVSPWFVFTTFCQPIGLHLGPVLVGSFGKIHGWGFNTRNRIDNNRGTNIPTKLRSIEVPVILTQNCIDRYRSFLEVTEKNICTYHPQRHSCQIDVGAGLIIDNTLAGVLLWSGLPDDNDNSRYPDVYANLHDTYYGEWIRINIETINLRYRNVHHD